MRKVLIVPILFISLLFFSFQSVNATTLDGKKYGVGFQMLSPELVGIGVTMDIGYKPVSVQPVIGLDPLPSAGFRLRYAFARKKFLDVYAAGMVGYADRLIGGIGVGIEWDWRMREKALPPISWSFEVGMNGPEFGVGLGIHYTF